MAKRKYKKQRQTKTNMIIIGLILLSVLLGVLIYTKSGIIGEKLNEIFGGIMGIMQYILPIVVFALAIQIACNKEEALTSKFILCLVLIISLCILFSTFQIATGELNANNEISQVIKDAYDIGTNSKGGGALGALAAAPLSNLLGVVGAIIFCISLVILLIVFTFGINIEEMINNHVENIKERRERKSEYIEEKQHNKHAEEPKPKNKKLLKKEKIEDDEMAVEQIQINFGGKFIDSEQKRETKNEKTISKGKTQPDFIESNLFSTVEEEKESKTKEVLQLEHTLTVEDENYEYPPIEILSKPEKQSIKGGAKALTDTASRLQKTLHSFGVSAKVENVSVGPAITRYELKPAEGVRVNKIANLADDIALSLAAETIRIEAPIPGKQAVGIEVPNKERQSVHLREVLSSKEFEDSKSKLTVALGKDVAGDTALADIAKMPHVLIAGSTGSGKSVCINTIITSMIYKSKPSEVKFVMIDPKVVELSVYNGIPHLLIPVVTDPKKAAGALAWAVQEMENRYSLFAKKGVRDLKGYNHVIETKEEGIGILPQIVIIIDELADLMMVAKNDVEDAICRLAQKARAAGMHLVIATQRPSVDVITGLIKANVPSRIAFAVSSQIDSRTILDSVGAEKLLGKGDMLFFPSGAPKPSRIQGAFVSDEEVEKIVDFLKANGEVKYNSDIIDSIENNNKTEKELIEEQAADDEIDPLLTDAIQTVVETGTASTSFIQRRFKVGYARAGRIIDQMEERGIISGYQGSKPRQVLMTLERLEELKMGTTENAE